MSRLSKTSVTCTGVQEPRKLAPIEQGATVLLCALAGADQSAESDSVRHHVMLLHGLVYLKGLLPLLALASLLLARLRHGGPILITFLTAFASRGDELS